jgi:hypothetical protein
MSVPGVEFLSTALRTTPEQDLFPIVTPLRWQRWEAVLSEAGLLDRFADVPLGLRFGFKIGVSSSVSTVFSPPNHKSAHENSAFIASQIKKEIDCGRYSVPLPPDEFLTIYGPYRTSPLGVVSNPTSGKQRLIQDHSFPRNNPSLSSVNAEIDASLFLCDWGSFMDCFTAVLDAPPGAQVAVFDVDAAHRRMPTAPEDRLHVCITWDGKVSMDHCCCFGCTSSSGIFGRVADAAKAIFLWKRMNLVLKWADDFSFWRFPSPPAPEGPWSYCVDESLLWTVADDLGWPWAPMKCKPFASSFRYIGFDWDLMRKSVALPEGKKTKFLSKLSAWAPGVPIDRKTCLSLTGSLSHCAVVVLGSRSHLPSLYRFSARFTKLQSDFIKLKPPPDVLEDVAWWRAALSADWCGIMIRPHPPELPEPFFVDASTGWGIGLVHKDRWLAWPLLDGWFSEGREIGWAEFVALELAVLTALHLGVRSATLLIRSDNQGVVNAFAAEYSRGPAQNAVLRRILLVLYEFDLWLRVVWIPSAENPADGPSRGKLLPWNRLISAPPKVPPALRPFVGHSLSAPPRSSRA